VSALAETITLFDMCSSDLDDVVALEKAAFPIPWKREYFSVEIGAPHRFNRIARDTSGRLAGYLFCAHAAGEIHVNKIAVSEEKRRQGVARLLMADVLELAEQIRAEEIYLEVRVTNFPARRFYESLGFVDAGRRTGYYFDGEDALVMVRSFKESV
jgi:ribosomal-protein-alanine acetyltransferase